MLLDSGAAESVVMSVYPLLTCVASTADRNSLSVSVQQGKLGPLNNVLISGTIRHQCISISQLSDIGVNVTFTLSCFTVANGVASVCDRREGELLYMLS